MNEPPKGVYLPAVFTYLAGLPSGVIIRVIYDPNTWKYYIFAHHEPTIDLPPGSFLISMGDESNFFTCLNKVVSKGCRITSKN